jgi:hypothetical protein
VRHRVKNDGVMLWGDPLRHCAVSFSKKSSLHQSDRNGAWRDGGLHRKSELHKKGVAAQKVNVAKAAISADFA